MTSTIRLSSAAGQSGRGQGPQRRLFGRLGRTVTAHPGRVALRWLLVVAALTAISAALGQPPPSSAAAAQLPAGYESARAQAAIDRAFGASGADATAVLVISRTGGRQLTGRDLGIADRAVAGLTGLEARRYAAGLRTPSQEATVRVSRLARSSPNHLIALAQVSFGAQSGTPDTGEAVVNIRSDIGRALTGSGLHAELTGQAASDADNALTEQLAVYGMLAAIVVLLLVLFRGPGLPLLVVATIYGAGTGVSSLLNIAAHLAGFQLGQTTTQLLPVVLFGVGTDYAVFLLYRYHDRLRQGMTTPPPWPPPSPRAPSGFTSADRWPRAGGWTSGRLQPRQIRATAPSPPQESGPPGRGRRCADAETEKRSVSRDPVLGSNRAPLHDTLYGPDHPSTGQFQLDVDFPAPKSGASRPPGRGLPPVVCSSRKRSMEHRLAGLKSAA